MNRHYLLSYIKTLTPETDSNLKFMNLMKSRLMSCGIPPEDANDIVAALSFDFSNIAEDDDALSDIASEYADYCKKAYDKLKLTGLTNKKLYDKIFNRVFLKIDF